jgi:hypothetical protein
MSDPKRISVDSVARALMNGSARASSHMVSRAAPEPVTSSACLAGKHLECFKYYCNCDCGHRGMAP